MTPGYEAVRRTLVERLYARRIVVDPYTLMEVATLINLYFARCDPGHLEGAEDALGLILRKLGVKEPMRTAREVISEVVARVKPGCEENHRL